MNGRMDTIKTAVLLEKLKMYDAELSQRNPVADCYTENLVDSVTIPIIPIGQKSVWAQYSIQVKDRAKLQQELQQFGIPTAEFCPIPIHLSTAYQYLDYPTGDFLVDKEISHKIISLPMHSFLENKEVMSIAEAVNHLVNS